MAMTPQQIQAYINAQSRVDQADRERSTYNVPGLGTAYRNSDGTISWADPNKADWNQMIDASGNTGWYERKTDIFDTIGKLGPLLVLGAAGLGATGMLGGAGTGAGLGGAGGYAGAAGDFGLLSAGSSALPEIAATGLGASGAGSVGGAAIPGGAATSGVASGLGGVLKSNPSLLASGAGGLLGAISSMNSPDSQTATSQNQIDPRMASILYGSNGNNGFLSQIIGQANTPQSAGISSFGKGVDSYLGSNGAGQLQNAMSTANSLQNSNTNAPQMTASQVVAPNQNAINLSPAYQDMIYGNPAENPYLTGAIGKGINQSNNVFQSMLQDATKNLTQNVLPSIRGGAQMSGQYGSNRQALAEGKALDSFNTGVTRAASQYGQNNTDAAVSAQAGAFDAGQGRALSAMGNLSGNQYNTANTNAGFQQQANQNNLQSQLNTQALDAQNRIAGLNASRGLLGDAYQYGTNNDAYGLNKLGNVSGMLQGYTGLNSSQTQSQPLYQNTGGNILGGALAGLGLYNQFNKA